MIFGVEEQCKCLSRIVHLKLENLMERIDYIDFVDAMCGLFCLVIDAL